MVRRSRRLRHRRGAARGDRRRRAGGQRRHRARRCSPASPGRPQTSCCSTPALRSTSAAAPAIWRRDRGGAGGNRLGCRGGVLRQLVAMRVPIRTSIAGAGPRIGSLLPRMSRLDQLVDAARDGVRTPQARGAARRAASCPARHAATAPALQGGAGAARALADRRVQAALAVGRRDPARARRRRHRRRLRARRRRGAIRAHRGTALRRLPRRPAGGTGGIGACRSSARTSSSIPTSSARPRRPAPTRCC